MLRDGPIPVFVHGLIEYAAGVLCIVAPFIFDFDDSAAVAVSIVIGVVIIAIASSSDLPTGLARSIARPAHVALDFALAVFLIAAPFMFGYSDETAPTAYFIALGVAHMLVTFGTRFREPGAEPS